MNTLIFDSFGNYKLMELIPRVGDIVFLNGYPRNVTNVIWFSGLEKLKEHFPEIYKNCPKTLHLHHYNEVIVYCGK